MVFFFPMDLLPGLGHQNVIFDKSVYVRDRVVGIDFVEFLQDLLFGDVVEVPGAEEAHVIDQDGVGFDGMPADLLELF